MSYSINYKNKSKAPLFVVVLVVAIIAITSFIVFGKKSTNTDNLAESSRTTEKDRNPLKDKPEYKSIDLQPTIDSWAAKYPATYSIQVIDLQNNQVIANNMPDKVMFAASLYKIYVAYIALVDFQTGAQNPDEILIAQKTKKQCVDAMIRSSDSPCGEAMMAEIGQIELNEKVKRLDIRNTTFNGIQTTASDSVQILKLINNKKDLNEDSTNYLLNAMLDQEQKFKRGLQNGAPEAKWYTKVGWNEDINYHDIGIMVMPDGRKFAVAILASGSGSPAPISDFAQTIYQKLENN